MRFRQAVPGTFFVREAFQGFGAPPSAADVDAATEALQALTESQNEMKRVINNRSCGYESTLIDLIQRSDADIDFIQSQMQAFLEDGAPSLPTIVGIINDHVAANDDIIRKLAAWGCDAVVDARGSLVQRSVTADPLNINTGGGSSGGGSSGGGGGGSSGGGSPSPPPPLVLPSPVEAGLGLGAWLLGGGLFAAMLLFSKKPPVKKTRKTRKTRKTTRRRVARRRTYRRR